MVATRAAVIHTGAPVVYVNVCYEKTCRDGRCCSSGPLAVGSAGSRVYAAEPGRYAVAAHKRGEPFYAVVAQRRGEPFARGAETRRGARYTRAGSWRGGRAAEHAAGPRNERGAHVETARFGESLCCRKAALGRTATLSRSAPSFRSAGSGVRVLRVRRQASCGSRWS